MTNNYCSNCSSYKEDEELNFYRCPVCKEYVLIKFERGEIPKAIKYILVTELELGDMIPIPYTDDFREILGIKENDKELNIGLKEYKQIKLPLTKRVNKLEGAWRL